MYIGVAFISGVMIGLEFLWEEKTLVVDLGIVRVLIGVYNGDEND
jgi:hypothetical protein